MAAQNLTIVTDSGITTIEFRPDSFAGALEVEKTGKELYAAVEKGDSKKLILDFGNVDYLSSVGLGVLLTLRMKAAKVGAAAVLANVRARFGEILSLTNLDKLFTIFDSRDAAQAHLRGAG